ncbi:MAG: hypothetical protein JWN15_769, partial [Firmicutes bacterium]|nr:hypothetical protein [Bacillota bacterium]
GEMPTKSPTGPNAADEEPSVVVALADQGPTSASVRRPGLGQRDR